MSYSQAYSDVIYQISRIANPTKEQSQMFHVSKLVANGYWSGATSWEFETFDKAIEFCCQSSGIENLVVMAVGDYGSTGHYHWYVGKEILK